MFRCRPIEAGRLSRMTNALDITGYRSVTRRSFGGCGPGVLQRGRGRDLPLGTHERRARAVRVFRLEWRRPFGLVELPGPMVSRDGIQQRVHGQGAVYGEFLDADIVSGRGALPASAALAARGS